MSVTVCNNLLLAVAIVTIGAVEVAALVMGHNGEMFQLALGAMVALAGGAPTINGFINARRDKVTAATNAATELAKTDVPPIKIV